MNKKLYMVCVSAFALAMLACSSENAGITGSSDDPNPVIAQNSSSSNLELELSSSSDVASSSSVEVSSSSSAPLVLCKVSGEWGGSGCIISEPSGKGDLWSINDYKVKTDAYAEDPSKFGNRAGELFFETDSSESGEKPIVLWFNGYKKDFDFGKGILKATIQLKNGQPPFDPFLKLGFYVAGFDSNGVALSADITNWNGICLLYEGTIEPTLQLDLGDSINQKIGYALPSVTVPSNSKPQCYEWKQFKQPDLDNEHEVISGEEAAKHVEKIIFYFWIQPKEEYYAIEQFEFIAIGTNRDE